MGTSATPLTNTSGFRMPEQPTVTVSVSYCLPTIQITSDRLLSCSFRIELLKTKARLN